MANAKSDNDEKRMTLAEHLEELRRRIIYALLGLAIAAGAALLFGRQLIWALNQPYVQSMRQAGREPDLAALSLSAGFATYLKVSLIAATMLASPWIFYQLWMFVSAGLYPKERRHVLFAVPVSAGLFICGAMFFLLVVSVPLVKFLIQFNDWMGLKLVVTFQSYVSMIGGMMLAFGLTFQTPLVLLFLARMSLISLRTLNHYRRHAIVAILIIAGLLTPPDPLSQIMLALPMWLLYELGVLLVWLLPRREPTPAG